MSAADLVRGWNALAERVVEAGLAAAAASALVLLLAALSWGLLRRRSSAHLGVALFLLPLVPLVLPLPRLLRLELPLPGAVASWFVGEPAQVPSGGSTRSGDGRAGAATSEGVDTPGPTPTRALLPQSSTDGVATASHVLPTSRTAPTEPPRVRPTVAAWGLLAWALVCAGLLLRFAAGQRATGRWVHAAGERPATDAGLERRVQLLARRSGLRGPVRVRSCAGLASPATWGLLRPTLLLPTGIEQRLDEAQLDWVLLHELAHLARRDLLVAAVQRVVQILWFFHPLVWWTNRAVEELREQACDEAALARSPRTRPDRCAEALLTVAAASAPPPTPQLALQTLTPDVTVMKKRILRLLDDRRPARPGLALATAPLLVAVASVSLAGVSLRGDATGAVASGASAPPTTEVGATSTALQDPIGVGGGAGGARRADGPARSERPAPQDGNPHTTARPDAPAAPGDVSAEALRAATRRGLDWVLARQHEDGHFPTGTETDRPEGEVTVVGMTGLAVLCLLEAEQQGHEEPRARALQRALDWLAAHQEQDTGRFGLDDDIRMVPSHALATWAWIAAHVNREGDGWRERAQRAVNYLLRARNPYGGWRYDVPPAGENDTVITGWAMIALAEAQSAGLRLDLQARDGGLMWFDEMFDPATGRTGYDQRGNPPSRLYEKRFSHPGQYSELCTAVAVLARLEWGQDPARTEAIRKGALLLVDQAPAWDTVRGTVDSYYWAFGTEAMARLGGFTDTHWRRALVNALVPYQLEDGSWPGLDAWSSPDTTVHETVVHLWSLLRAQR